MSFDYKDKKRLAKSIVSDKDEAKEGPHGTPDAEYLPARCGPFRCDHCEHYSDGGRCDQVDVVGDPQMKKRDGFAIVDPGGCCRFMDPGGDKRGRQ